LFAGTAAAAADSAVEPGMTAAFDGAFFPATTELWGCGLPKSMRVLGMHKTALRMPMMVFVFPVPGGPCSKITGWSSGAGGAPTSLSLAVRHFAQTSMAVI
jgi:hypothetical protein